MRVYNRHACILAAKEVGKLSSDFYVGGKRIVIVGIALNTKTIQKMMPTEFYLKSFSKQLASGSEAKLHCAEE